MIIRPELPLRHVQLPDGTDVVIYAFSHDVIFLVQRLGQREPDVMAISLEEIAANAKPAKECGDG